ncbi:MAG TPA: biotin/lipoyl-containing protein [Vicinamibacterales bacterium]|nr:biotin/lipoyl-containing protein [Vicinamibacterales bacterium]
MPKRLYLSTDDQTWTAEVSSEGVRLDSANALVPVEALRGRAAIDGDVVWATVEGEVFVFDVRRSAGQDRRSAHHGVFTSPMPATVVRIAVNAGDRVQAGDVLIALEAMKMELPIRAPRDGVVRAINCREGDLVQPDQELLEFE